MPPARAARYIAVPPAYVPPGPVRVLTVTGARAVTRRSATEGPARWAATGVRRWSAKEGGNR